MSSLLALGAVSAVLRGIVERSVSDHDLTSVLGATPEVSALPPDRIASGAGTPDRINLFLFQASENAAWRNLDFPSRNGNGDRIANPKLALDLHYLVTAYGAAEFRAEVLLGHAMFVFHETPVLTRQAIRDTLAALPGSALTDALEAARLADQIEQIKIVPRALSVEEVSKIWSALQSQYRTTAAYHVSVVLVEADQPARSPLPVLTRGRPLPALGRDEGIFATPSLLPPVPTLESLLLPAGQPAIVLGETLTLRGHHLAGAAVRARLRPLRGNDMLEFPAAAGAGEGSFDVIFGPNPAWQAGVYSVSAVVDQAGVTRETNRLPLAVAPRIDGLVANVVAGELQNVQVTCSPPVRPEQTVVLLVGTHELRPTPFAAPTGTLTFPAPATPPLLPSGQQWARLRVDGIESLLIDYSATPPEFRPAHSVTVP